MLKNGEISYYTRSNADLRMAPPPGGSEPLRRGPSAPPGTVERSSHKGQQGHGKFKAPSLPLIAVSLLGAPSGRRVITKSWMNDYCMNVKEGENDGWEMTEEFQWGPEEVEIKKYDDESVPVHKACLVQWYGLVG